MNQKETIERMCALITEVGEYFDHTHSHDCICGGENERAEVSDILVSYIETAVKKAIKDESINRCGFCGSLTANTIKVQDRIVSGDNDDTGFSEQFVCEHCIESIKKLN